VADPYSLLRKIAFSPQVLRAIRNAMKHLVAARLLAVLFMLTGTAADAQTSSLPAAAKKMVT
jgi:hypothetical protein